MAKRFISTEVWSEDWFLDMPNEYKLFWFYVITNCDHAGIFKVNLRSFCGLNEVSLSSKKAIEYFNSGKERVIEINPSIWLISDFFVFQYGPVLNLNNKVHNSINNIYKKYKIDFIFIRGLVDLKERTKDKDKDKDKDNSLTKKQKFEENEEFKPSGNFKAQGEELYAWRLSRGNKANRSRKEDS